MINIEEILNIICEASIEPISIFDEQYIYNCNEDFQKIFQIPKITSKIQNDIITDNLMPSLHTINGDFHQKLEQISFITASTDKSNYIPIKLKKWCLEGHSYYTLCLSRKHNIFPRVSPDNIPNPDVSFSKIAQILDSIPYGISYTNNFGSQSYINKVYKECYRTELNQAWDEMFHPDHTQMIFNAFSKCLKVKYKLK